MRSVKPEALNRQLRGRKSPVSPAPRDVGGTHPAADVSARLKAPPGPLRAALRGRPSTSAVRIRIPAASSGWGLTPAPRKVVSLAVSSTCPPQSELWLERGSSGVYFLPFPRVGTRSLPDGLQESPNPAAPRVQGFPRR